MGKLLVRLTVAIVSIYFVITYLVAQFMYIDISSDWYATLFALIIAVYAHSEGRYHCKYLKFTADSVFVSDLLTRLDNSFNFLFVTAHNLIPIGILALGVGTTITLSIRHFWKVLIIRNKKNKQ